MNKKWDVIANEMAIQVQVGIISIGGIIGGWEPNILIFDARFGGMLLQMKWHFN